MSEDSSDDENFDSELLIRDFENEAQLVIDNLLPIKSRDLYLKVYEDFMKWKNQNSASFDEKIFLVYFEELAKKFKPPTLWSIWSKLKATLTIIKEGINLEKFQLLKTSLKNKSKGYIPKKSKILTLSEIKKFLELASDTIYLSTKVILIFGFFGALRCQEIINIQTTDIEDTNNQFIISVNETKTYLSRNFIIAKEYYDIVKKYMLLRPDGMLENRFCKTNLNNKQKENLPFDHSHLASTSKHQNLSPDPSHLASIFKNQNVSPNPSNLASISKNQNVSPDPSHLASTSRNQNNENTIYLNNELIHDHNSDSGEPRLKKMKTSVDEEEQNLSNSPPVLLQNCEVHNLHVNNNYYYSSKED